MQIDPLSKVKKVKGSKECYLSDLNAKEQGLIKVF